MPPHLDSESHTPGSSFSCNYLFLPLRCKQSTEKIVFNPFSDRTKETGKECWGWGPHAHTHSVGSSSCGFRVSLPASSPRDSYARGVESQISTGGLPGGMNV